MPLTWSWKTGRNISGVATKFRQEKWSPEGAEAVIQRCSVRKVFLKSSQNSQENTCARVSLITLQALVFSFEFCEIFKNTFFTEHLWATASGTKVRCIIDHTKLTIRKKPDHNPLLIGTNGLKNVTELQLF